MGWGKRESGREGEGKRGEKEGVRERESEEGREWEGKRGERCRTREGEMEDDTESLEGCQEERER